MDCLTGMAAYGTEGALAPHEPEPMLSRKRVWEIVEVARGDDVASRVFDAVIICLILASTAAIVLESVAGVRERYQLAFDVFEWISVSVFTIEYVARLWACPVDERFRHPVWGRLRFASRPLLMIDLLAIAPFFMLSAGLDLRFVRVLRAFRVLRIAKLTRYSKALQLMGRVLRRTWDELAVTLFAIAIMLVLASILMYAVEHNAQPEKFADIPTTMWWAVITLTTVGYGDVYPITVLGKCTAALISVLGVGLLALPTAILGAAFVDELAAPKKAHCPHCGEKLEKET